jgi:hypothetical protein
MRKRVVGLLDNFGNATRAVKDMLGAGFDSDSVTFGTSEAKHMPVVAATADNEIMADRAVVILRRYRAAEIDERPAGTEP